MKNQPERIINGFFLIFLTLIIIDHLTQYSYFTFFAQRPNLFTEGYMEIFSLFITVSVPFFYRLYKNRENQIEDAAFDGHEGDDKDKNLIKIALQGARSKSDSRKLIYYSAAALSLIICIYFQSIVLNSQKVESKKRDEELAAILATLHDVQQRLTDRTNELMSIIQTENASWLETRKRLEKTIEKFSDINRHVELMTGTMQKTDKDEKKLLTGSRDYTNDFKEIRDELAELRTELMTSIKANQTVIERMERQLSSRQVRQVPETTQAPPSSSGIQDNLRENLLLFSELLEEFQNKKKEKLSEVEILKENRSFINGFLQICDGRGMDRNQVKMRLISLDNDLKTLSSDLLNSVEVQNLDTKLQLIRWLSWRMKFPL